MGLGSVGTCGTVGSSISSSSSSISGFFFPARPHNAAQGENSQYLASPLFYKFASESPLKVENGIIEISLGERQDRIDIDRRHILVLRGTRKEEGSLLGH